MGAKPVQLSETSPRVTKGPWLLAGAIFIGYAVMSLARFQRIAHGSFDLALFTQAVAGYAKFEAPISNVREHGYNVLGEHFHPILALLGPLYRLAPSPMTLLVAQALLIAVSVVPITRLAIERLGTGSGYAVGTAYGVSWGLQAAVDFDFHEIAFAVPLIAFSLVAVVEQRFRHAVLWALPLVLVKEDLGFVVAGIGVVIALRGKRLIGAALGVFGIAATLIEIGILIPAINPEGKYPFWKQAGAADPTAEQGPLGMISALGEQLSTSADVKVHTLFLLLLPTAFLALRSPITLIAVIPLGLRFISPNEFYWGTTFHYSAPLMPILFVAAIDALIRLRAAETAGEGLRDRARKAWATHGAVAMLAIAIALTDKFPLSQFWDPETMFSPEPRVEAAWRAIEMVPDGATVETTLNMLAPLSGRTDTYWIGHDDNPVPQYVVFDQKHSGAPVPPEDPLRWISERHDGAPFETIYADGHGLFVFVSLGDAPSR